MKSKIKVAAVQAAPVFLNLDATVKKAEGIIEEAAEKGANLIAMPEAFFPGYPYWVFCGDVAFGMQFWRQLYDNALTIPGKAIAKLSNAAKKNNVYLCVSGTEKDGGSLYLTQFWFNSSGDMIGKHRKVRPTGAERTIWGDGDGSMMPVIETELGRVGGLQCWEHCMVINNLIMNSKNEQLHVAAWPGFSWDTTSLHHYETAIIATKYYSITTGTYSIMTSDVMTRETIEMVCGEDDVRYREGCAAGACIINPAGKVISDIVPHDEEGIAYADIDWNSNDVADAKYNIDITGHYSKGSVAQVIYNNRPQGAVIASGEDMNYGVLYEDLQNL